MPEQYLDERLAAAREMQANTKVQELSDGRIIVVMHEPMEHGGWVATHEDITQLRRIEAQMSHMARHDALTDLPNRVLLRERIEQTLERAECAQEPLARRAAVRHRPLQGGQRHARPLDRRRAAAGRGAAPAPPPRRAWR